jgi:tetratricopeptide (TPR) repeat protein
MRVKGLNVFSMMFLFVFYTFQSYGSSNEILAKNAIQAMQNFHFTSADSICSLMERNHAHSYLTHLTRANYYWWHIISQEYDSELEKKYLNSLDKAQRAIVLSDQAEYSDIFYYINIFALKARLDVKNNEYLRAVNHLRRCIVYIEKSLGNESMMTGLYLTSGLYNYVADYGVTKYPFFRVYTWLYPKGCMTTGIQQLKTAAESDDNVISTEAHYFLMKIYLELENNYNMAQQHSKWLINRHPDNLIYLYHHYEIIAKLEQRTKAELIKKDFFIRLGNHGHLHHCQKIFLEQLILNK